MATRTWGPWHGFPTPGGLESITAKVDAACRLAVSTSPSMTSPVYFSSTAPNASGIIAWTPTGLASLTQYYCEIELNGVLTTTGAKFRTAPALLMPANCLIVFGSCAGIAPVGGYPNLSTFSNHPIFAAMLARNPDLFLHLGDIAYADITDNDPTKFRGMFDGVFAQSRQAAMFAGCGGAYQYSDHDSGPNGGDKTGVYRPAARQVFQEVTPHSALPLGLGNNPTYFEGAWGRIRFFFPDCRLERDPTAGTTVEEVGRSRLGAVQKAYLKARQLAARETFQILALEGTFIGKPDCTSDSWTGVTQERDELTKFWVANKIHKRLITLGGDMHAVAFDSGDHNYNGCGVPHLVAAPFDQNANSFSGPYDTGIITPPAGSGQYGVLQITDDGSNISWTASAYRVDAAGVETQIV